MLGESGGFGLFVAGKLQSLATLTVMSILRCVNLARNAFHTTSGQMSRGVIGCFSGERPGAGLGLFVVYLLLLLLILMLLLMVILLLLSILLLLLMLNG